MNTEPVAVAFITSGSRGNRLIFYHKGRQHEEGFRVKDVASELPPTTLAEILAPSSLMVDRKFELTVDEWRFIGHPFSIHNQTFSIAFSVIFVVQSNCTSDVVLAYDHISHLLGSAIAHEEEKCSFLKKEVATLMQLLEEADIPDPSADVLLEQSSLARSLHFVICSLQDGNTSIDVKINNWAEVSTLVQFGPQQVDIRQQTVQPCVRSYSALLLYEDCEAIIESLPPFSNPSMHRLLRVVSPMKSLQAVSLDADIPLPQVLHLASHLVYWSKAIAIYPLSESNVYITSPSADTKINSDLAEMFQDVFKIKEPSLVDLLSNFSLPISLGDLKDMFADDPHKIIQMVVWLLQHKQIVQLHTYVYIVPQKSGNFEDVQASPHSLFSQDSSGHGNGNIAELLQHLNLEERQSILSISAASDIEDLEEFARLSKYFHGNQHLEGIMLIENIPRSQLLTLIDKFSEVLVTCTLPEQLTLY